MAERSLLARCSIRVVISSPLRFVAKTIAFALSASLIHVLESLTSPTNRRHPLWCNSDADNVSLALTRHHTSWPALLNASAMALPMYPVAPNTSTRNFVIFFCLLLLCLLSFFLVGTGAKVMIMKVLVMMKVLTCRITKEHTKDGNMKGSKQDGEWFCFRF